MESINRRVEIGWLTAKLAEITHIKCATSSSIIDKNSINIIYPTISLPPITMTVIRGPGALTVAALIISLSSSAFACLEIKGSTWDQSMLSDGVITTIDNGVQTCSGKVGRGDQNVGMF